MRLINLAYDMMSQVVGRKYGKGAQLEIKIGIHIGPVIAGVIGHHKPQFSLIGDPVNQTSRVASTGDSGAITLSEAAYLEARRWIKYYCKTKKYAKGLGDIYTYQVFNEKPPHYQIPKVQHLFTSAFKKLKDNKDFQALLKEAKKNKKSFLNQLKVRQQEEILKEEEEKKMKQSHRKSKTKNSLQKNSIFNGSPVNSAYP